MTAASLSRDMCAALVEELGIVVGAARFARDGRAGRTGDGPAMGRGGSRGG